MSDVPPFPALSDRADGSYNSKAFAFGSHMADTFNGELAAVATSVVQNATAAESSATAAETSAQTATASMQAAIASTGVAPWVSGQSYALNTCAISQVNFQTYRRIVAGAGTTDPTNDSASWAMLAGQGSFIPQVAATATFDLSKSNYFKRTLNGNETWDFIKCPQDGYSWTVEVTHVSGVLSLPSSVKTPTNQVYVFTAGKTHELMFVTSNKGARIRLVAAPNFDN
jgi:hypothetical protein